jgi:hypothetical protein
MLEIHIWAVYFPRCYVIYGHFYILLCRWFNRFDVLVSANYMYVLLFKMSYNWRLENMFLSCMCQDVIYWGFLSCIVSMSYSVHAYIFYWCGRFHTLSKQLSRGGGWDTIKRFNAATFLCLSQARTWIFNVICHGVFCVLCWYWFNCWPVQFKLTFHICSRWNIKIKEVTSSI